jgi:hypothetical protein
VSSTFQIKFALYFYRRLAGKPNQLSKRISPENSVSHDIENNAGNAIVSQELPVSFKGKVSPVPQKDVPDDVIREVVKSDSLKSFDGGLRIAPLGEVVASEPNSRPLFSNRVIPSMTDADQVDFSLRLQIDILDHNFLYV